MAVAGVVLRSDVSGKIQMKCFLTVRAVQLRDATAQTLSRLRAQGMPELKLGLNDRLSGGDGGADSGPSSFGGGAPSGREASGCGSARCACLAQRKP